MCNLRRKGVLMRNSINLLLAFTILFFTGSLQAITWTTLDNPRAHETMLSDIDGSNILSSYGDLYNLDNKTWTQISLPHPTTSTWFEGISGNNIVGHYINNPEDGSGDYKMHGFLYNLDSQTFTTLDLSGMGDTFIYAIDGFNIAGSDVPSEEASRGFLYNLTSQTLTTPANPWGDIFISGIYGNNLVGQYGDGMSYHGFLYDNGSWTTLDLPEVITGIGGRKVVTNVGFYNLDSRTFVPLAFPGADYTWIEGIDGDNIVGFYTDASGVNHGFLAVIPEPASAVFLVLGVGLARRFIKKHRG
jgi:hypothetical protein